MRILRQFVILGQSRLEAIEKLEQLRLLENGIPIDVVITNHHSIGVDRPEDIKTVTKILQGEMGIFHIGQKVVYTFLKKNNLTQAQSSSSNFRLESI